MARDAEGGLRRLMRLVTRRQQRLGRDAAVVEAVAPHLVALDQDDLRAHLDRARRDGEAAGPGADDADVGLDTGHGHGLSGRMEVSMRAMASEALLAAQRLDEDRQHGKRREAEDRQ
jgi:hypothetical protein